MRSEDTQPPEGFPLPYLPPPPTPPPPPRRHRIRLIVAASILIGVVVVASLFYSGINPWFSNPQDGNKEEVTIACGTPILAVSQSVGVDGGTIEVSNTSSPLYGMRIEVPEAASNETIRFTVSYSDVFNITGLPQNASVASKLISIGTSGSVIWNEYKTFDVPVTVTLPYDPSLVPVNAPVRFYYYDEENHVLDAAGFLYENLTNHTITFCSGSFSQLVGFWLKLSYSVGQLFGEYTADSGFRPKTNGWYMPNYGSYLEPDGICSGMCCYAKWYYRHKSVGDWLQIDPSTGAWEATGIGLYKKYIEGNPDEWRDDATAIQLATRAHFVAKRSYLAVLGAGEYAIASAPSTKETYRYEQSLAHDVALTWLHGIIVTHEPQLVGLTTRFANGEYATRGHVVLAYRYSNGRFDVYDPNYPATDVGTDARQILYTFGSGFGRSYTSGPIVGQGNREYNIFMAYGVKTFGPERLYRELFDSAEKKFQDLSYFPTVTLTDFSTIPEGTTPVDTDGDGYRDTDEKEVTISGTITGGADEVAWTWLLSPNREIQVPVIKGEFTARIPLRRGDNTIVILATGKNSKCYRWAGYLKETIRCTVPLENLTITLTCNQEKSSIELHVVEPTLDGREGRHIYVSNPGADLRFPCLYKNASFSGCPQVYYAMDNMTLPNYQGPGKSLYGTYMVRVQYSFDWSGNIMDNITQPVKWYLVAKMLVYADAQTGQESYITKTTSGTLTVATTLVADDFNSTHPSWSAVWTVVYSKPNPAGFQVPLPPQNKPP